jgi:hypothetical protein
MEENKMKIKEVLGIIAAIIVGLVVLVSARNFADSRNYYQTSFGGNTLQNANNAVQDIGTKTVVENGVQNVRLFLNDDFQYQLDPPVLRKGIPVKMEVDMGTVAGCMTNIVIPGFNIRKSVSKGNNIIEFTPDKSGKFQISCSMGMGRSTFTVAEETGEISTYVEPTPAAGASCGAGGGGCGCGGGKL